MGRTFLPEDGQPNQPRTVVISYGFWQRRFGGDSKIIGRTRNINRKDAPVIGVMPRGFEWFIKKGSLTNKPAEVWSPFPITNEIRTRQGRYMTVVGRLKPGVSYEQAQAEMQTIGARLSQQF